MCGQGFMLGPGLGRILSDVIADGPRARAGRYGFILEQLEPGRKFEGTEMLE